MKKYILLLVFCFAMVGFTKAQQTRYIIKFKDKATNPFTLANPSSYLGTKALQRRTRYNISIDSLDLPVTPRYVDSIRLAGAVTILNVSKWLNQVSIKTTDAAALIKISNLPFVVSTTPIASFSSQQTNSSSAKRQLENIAEPIASISMRTANTSADVFSYGNAGGQIRLHQGSFLHNHGFRGDGMQVTVLDAGFYHYLSLPTFDSIRNSNQILEVMDFVAKDGSVNEDDSHGMKCLSTIAANIPGVFVGTAPKANFTLYRTEDVASETRIEEHNLAAGYERADSIGSDVCSVSLGYNTFDYTNQNYTYAADMTGRKTMSAIASNIAARKGMMPVIAAGNDGNNSWHYVATPGDADSAMTVGAVDTLGTVAGFSSYGPNSSGVIKPNVSATGLRAVVANSNTGLPELGNGTSYATPNMAGLTTCLWQAFPEFNNMTMLDGMQRAATKFSNPDDRVGYGIPDMKKAFCYLLKKSYTQNVNVNNCNAAFSFNVKFDNTMKVVIEKKQSNQTNYIALNTINGTGNFLNKSISYSDNLSATNNGATLYRIRIDIATDTSFYLDSISVNVNKPSFGADKIIAKCNSSIVNLNSLYNTAGTNFNWTQNGNTVIYPTQVAGFGIFQLIGISNIGCADTALVTINAIPSSDVNLGADKVIAKCSDSTINLNNVFVTTNLATVWTLGNTILSNVNSVNTAGNYQVIATNNYGCVDTANASIRNDVTLCPALGIKITPNPVADYLLVSINKGYVAAVEILITNELGQRIYSVVNKQAANAQTYKIPMSALSNAVYFVSVLIDGKVEVTEKVLKK